MIAYNICIAAFTLFVNNLNFFIIRGRIISPNIFPFFIFRAVHFYFLYKIFLEINFILSIFAIKIHWSENIFIYLTGFLKFLNIILNSWGAVIFYQISVILYKYFQYFFFFIIFKGFILFW